ncbi:DUF2975 domain-containing protein [Luteimonas sp. RD2P54]|uniref:DUF2975 domain-containing protein n=1 Tax=Luteimonas endophytica TaxID=3042023 RepID=A0ABT6J8Y3_9GAMM|nr:DUF2975 domain-containing protein [Luteimonas endophytica]MDH5823070.1 DUF2975 domain-containing protein [Luteimonas endophytica]
MNTTKKTAGLYGRARWLRRVALFGAGLCLAVTLLAVFGPAAGVPGLLAATLHTDGLPHPWAGAIALLLAALVAAALWQLARMLGEVERGALFAPGATRHFRRFALLLLVAALLRLLLPPLAVLALVALERSATVTLSFSGGDVLALFVAVVLFFVARLFDEAARLEEDSRSIV